MLISDRARAGTPFLGVKLAAAIRMQSKANAANKTVNAEMMSARMCDQPPCRAMTIARIGMTKPSARAT